MSWHSYKNKRGMYYRGRSKSGRYYTRQGCLVQIIQILLLITLIIVFLFK